jgi:hypothetical protein
MAAAIRRLYDRNLEELGALARQRALQSFTWSNSLNIQLANYAGVFATARARPSVTPVMGFGAPGRP